MALKKGVSIVQETCSCRPIHYFGTLFWDDITKFWDENLFSNWQTEKNPVLDQ